MGENNNLKKINEIIETAINFVFLIALTLFTLLLLCVFLYPYIK